MLARVRSWLRALAGRRAFEAGLSDELRAHMEMYADDLVAAGVDPAEARRRARLEFGNPDAVARDCRDERGLALADTVSQDVRQAVRLARRTPVLTAMAVATVAVCVGGNLALFAVVEAVLLRPLPLPSAERLVRVYNTYPRAGVPDDGISLTNYYERRDRLAGFERIAAFRASTGIVGVPGGAAREDVLQVSPDFFDTLGVGPAAGRPFREAETSPGADAVAIVSDGYWRHVLGAPADAVGRRIRVDGLDKTIVGVLPPSFAFLSSNARIYLPLASAPEQRQPDRRHWGSQAQMVARLAPGVTLEQAQSQVDAHNAAVERGGKDAAAMAAAGFRSMVVSLRADHVAQVRPALLLLQAGALVLFGLGIVNLVNLLLIRAAGRTRELAIRQAIGARRAHVIVELAAELVVIALPGAALALVLAAAGIGFLNALGLDRLPLGASVELGSRHLLIALGAAAGCTLVAGLPVAWHNLAAHGADALHARSRTTTASRAAARVRHALVAAQVALAFVLLAGAGLLAVSLSRVAALSPWFGVEQVATARVTLPWADFQDTASRVAFVRRLAAALGSQPGVRSVGAATNVPLSGNATRSAATVEGSERAPGEPPHAIYSYGVFGGFFEALGVPLRAGRLLDARDERPDVRVCVVDEAFARREFPDGRVLGRRLFMGGSAGPARDAFTIVGIVGALKQGSVTDDATQGAVFYPFGFRDDGEFFVVARHGRDDRAFESELQATVRQISSSVAVDDVKSMQERVDDSLVTRRSPALLAAAFASVALLLTCLGTYGVFAHSVAQRRREIGVRLALGASPGQVRAGVVRAGLRLAAVGLAAGGIAAWTSGRAMSSLLFGVEPLHAPTLAGAAAVVAVVALAACAVPASRAARVAPAEALAED